MKKIYRILSLSIISLSVISSSCKKDGVINRGDISTGGKIKFIHASPDAPQFNLFVNGEKITGGIISSTGVEQGMAYSTTGLPTVFGYSNFDPAALTIKSVVSPSSTTVAAGTELFSTGLTVEANKYYSVFAMDSLASITPVVFTDNMITENGKAGIRFVNATAKGSPVDLVATFTEVNATTSTEFTLATNIAFKAGTEFIASNPGKYVFQMKDSGTGAKVGSALSLTFLRASENYTVYGRGGVSAPSIAGFYNR